MNPLRRLLLRLRAMFRNRALENDMQEEMRQHLALAAERHEARGLTPAEARLAARREFGNVTLHEEHGRDARGMRWLDALRGDMRFAFRYFARHQGMTALILVVLALGTGGNTVIFSLVQAQFFRPAPAMPDDDALTRILVEERPTHTAAWDESRFSGPELAALRERREIFADVVAWTEDEVIIGGSDSTVARTVNAQFVTPNYFGALALPLAAGPGLAPAAGEADAAAVMSHAMATLLFGSPAAAVGQRVHVNERSVRIVGVAPYRFQGARRNMDEPALWLPLGARAVLTGVSPRWLTDDPALSLTGRLAAGATLEQATAFVRQVVTAALPDSAARVGMARTAHVIGLTGIAPGPDRAEMVLAFTFVIALAVLILLVAWMNVSSLMVAAAVTRRHEIAVRLSLGASRARLLRQLVTESTLLALGGGAAGLLGAWWFLTGMMTRDIDGYNIAPDAGTFAFVLIMALVTGILFGLSPALHATRGGVANALRDSGTGAGAGARGRLQRGFVVAQIALSQPLLVMLGTMLSLIIADYRPLAPEMSRHVISAAFRPLPTAAPGQRPEAVDSLVPRLAALPGVVGAVPVSEAFAIRGVDLPARATGDSGPAMVVVHVEGAAPGWFELVDVPIVLGRDVAFADTGAADYPVVISGSLARQLWSDANPIGRTLASAPIASIGQRDSITMTVVGVYDASKRLPGMAWGGFAVAGAITEASPRVFTARGKQWGRDVVLVRTRTAAAPYVTELQRRLRDLAPSLPVVSVRTLAQIDEEDYQVTLRMAATAGAGGLLALLLASLGLYGVISLAVKQRTREIGIRIAVGAHPTRVARMFLSSGLRTCLVALALGLPLSVIGLKVGMAQGLLLAPEVNPFLIGALIAPILVGVAALATWLPARRATRVDPASTLRAE